MSTDLEIAAIASGEIPPLVGDANRRADSGDASAGSAPAAASVSPPNGSARMAVVPPGAMEPESTLTEHVVTTKDNAPQPVAYDFNWVRVLTLMLLFAPTVPMYLLIFTEIGYGATVMKLLSYNSSWSRAVGGLGFFTIFFLHMFDFTHWRTPLFRILRAIGLAVFSFCCLVAVALSFNSRPYAPILAYFVMVCLGFSMIYVRFYKRAGVSVLSFINALSYAIILGGVVGLGVAIGWAFSNNFLWGFDSKREFRARLRVCDSAYASTSAICESYGRVGNRCPCVVYADDIGSHCAPGGGCVEVPYASACSPDKPFCLASMLLWGGQLILSLMTVVVGLAILLVSNAAIPRDGEDGKKVGVRGSPGVRMFGYLVGSLVVVIWVAASLGGAAMELSNVVTAFAATMLMCLFGIGVASVGGKDFKAKFENSERGQKLNKMIRTNPLVGGITLMAFGILLPFFFAISYVNQLFRKYLSFTKDLPEEEKHLPFTAFGHRILDIMKGWNWARVLVKVIVIGLVYLIVQVGIGKVTSLFLAWLNQLLGGVNFFLVTVIVYFIGMALFLIPAVPGVPVYVANGVMLGASGTKQFGNFWVAMVWAVGCAFITKISACIFQQKVIGEQLGSRVTVRSMVGINSDLMKAIRIILEEKGMTMAKVFLLVGGPDWPTSVITGILRQNVVQMMMGTVPILGPVACTVISGGCLLRTSEGNPWTSLASLFMTLSAASLGGAFIGAMLQIDKIVKYRKADIDAIPDDEEVKVMDQAASRKEEAMASVKTWGKTPTWLRILLVIGAVTCYLATMLFAGASDLAFEDINLSTDYRQPPLNGNILNMVKMPVGWIGLGLDGISIIVYIIYGQWAKYQGNKVLKMQDTIAPAHAAAAPDFTNVESANDGAKSPAVAGGIYASQPEGVPTPPLAESATLATTEGVSA